MNLIFSVFVATIFASLLFSNSQAFAQEQFLTYEDITTGISIQFPSNWEKSVNLDNFVTFRAPPEIDTRVYPAALGLKIDLPKCVITRNYKGADIRIKEK